MQVVSNTCRVHGYCAAPAHPPDTFHHNCHNIKLHLCGFVHCTRALYLVSILVREMQLRVILKLYYRSVSRLSAC